ncbi:MAG TPA: hypothetical protein VFV93_01480, partial [Thermomicrobiales bacterium]|nr:hypothetical protein [Thermomicrobiales bacterium]
MLTFTRAGQSTLYVEDPIDPASFGILGFLLPENTPHLPTQLTIEESWYWKNNTLGAGWYIFIAPGVAFPNPKSESQLLSQFVTEMRKSLPSVPAQQSSGFAWVVGDPQQPTAMSVVRLDMVGTGNRNSGNNPSTSRYDQTFTFKQFVITVAEKTEVQIKSDFSGFEILSTLNEPTVHMHIPVAPYVYRPATTVTVPFSGEGRGALQFTLEPLLPTQFGYGALDVSLFYFLRPNGTNGSTAPQLLRYPIIDAPHAEGTFEFQANLYHVDQRSSFFTVKDLEDGTPKRIASYFRTTAGFPVHLRSSDNARLYLRARPNLNPAISDLEQIYYLAPSG